MPIKKEDDDCHRFLSFICAQPVLFVLSSVRRPVFALCVAPEWEQECGNPTYCTYSMHNNLPVCTYKIQTLVLKHMFVME